MGSSNRVALNLQRDAAGGSPIDSLFAGLLRIFLHPGRRKLYPGIALYNRINIPTLETGQRTSLESPDWHRGFFYPLNFLAATIKPMARMIDAITIAIPTTTAASSTS